MKILKKIIICFLIIFPFLYFYIQFYINTVDIPVNDDYAILNFLNKLVCEESFSEKLKLIFAQHNEHRIVFDRICAVLIYKFNQQINFNLLSLLGNLSLIPIFFILFFKLKKINQDILFAIPISVLIFNISFHENITFAMANLSNFTVILFSLICLHFISNKILTTKVFIWAMIFLGLAVLTQGSGLFLIPIIAAILIYKRDFKKFSVFTFYAILILFLYFYDYHKPPDSPDILSTILDFKVRAVLFSFAFLGNAFNYNLIFTNDLNESIGVTAIIGFVFFVTYFYIFNTKYYKKNLFVFATLSFIVLTALISGVTRCQYGLDTAGASRYRLNGVVFLIGIYLWVVDTCTFKFKSTGIIILISSILYFYLFNSNQVEYLNFRKNQSLFGVLNYHSGDYKKLNGFEQDFYKEVLLEARKQQTYFLPSYKSLGCTYPFSKKISDISLDHNSQDLFQNIERITKIKDGFIIEGWAFIKDCPTENQTIYVVIKNTILSELNVFEAKQTLKFDLNPFFKKKNLEKGGFMLRLKDLDIKEGDNAIGILLKSENTSKFLQTDKKITR